MAKPSSARENLIVAAAELFRERGYEGVGVAELLERSGAPRGSLYFHFPGGKEQIGVEAVTAVGAAITDQLKALNASGVDIDTFIERVFKATAKGVKERDFRASCPIAAIAVEASDRAPLLQAAVREAFASWEAEVRIAAEARGMSAKNAADFASAMLVGIEGALVASKAQGATTACINAAKAMKAFAHALMAP